MDRRELEWQLAAPDLIAVRRWLAEHEAIDGLRIEPRPAITLHDTYFDTDDWRMHRAGFALRVRASSDGSEATLKTLSSARPDAADRREVSETLPDDAAEALGATLGPVGQRVRAMAGVRALHPLFEVRTERERFAIHKDDAEIGEIALDDTVIARAGGEPQAGVRRVEVEALTPAVEPLEGLVQALRAGCTLELAAESKYRVGLEAAGLAPPIPAQVEAPAIDARMRIDAVAFAELRRRLAQWHAHEPGARLGENPNELHQLRVAGRRIDATLRLFQGHVSRSVSRSRSVLKKVLRVLGTCRDFDVQLAELDRLAQSFPESERPALEPVRAWLSTERERARRQMLKTLDAPTSQRWFESLAIAILDPPAETQRPRLLAIQVAPGLVRRRFRKVRKLGDRLHDESSMEEYHRVRTQLKKLRYAVETFAPLYGKEADEFLDVVLRLQNRLGEQQDAHVAATRLTVLARLKTGRLPHSTAFLMGRMAERHDAAALKARGRFGRAYRRVRGKRWKQLRSAMKEQEQAVAGAQ